MQQKTLVIARKVVNLGPQSTAATPSPFTLDLVLDAPFVDVGVQSLVWEVVIHSNTISGTMLALDADSSSSTPAPGRPPSTITGPGCLATGASGPCAMDIHAADIAGLLAFGVAVNDAPANVPAVLALGTTNPNLALPGLCSNLSTDLAILLPIGMTDAIGVIGELNSVNNWFPSEGSTFVIPNVTPNLLIHSQVHVLDPSSMQPIPVVNSNGRSITMPASNLSKVVRVSRLFNNLGGTTAARGHFINTTTLGYGLVTRFTY